MPPYRYLFGPLPSRRFGRSLGVDLTPLKTCTLDCAFCQLGHTPETTIRRAEHVPLADVLEELRTWQAADGKTDFITLAGSGEPTLHTGFGAVIDWVNRETPHRSLLLSNGTLMDREPVRRAAAAASIVKVSLSAWDQASFERLMHPHPALRFEAIMEGYRALRAECRGELWLEVFLVPGVNDTPEQVARIAELAAQLSPDTIQLNTAVRPAADRKIVPLDGARLARLALCFNPVAEPCRPAGATDAGTRSELPTAAALASIVRRHPLSLAGLARFFEVAPADLAPLLAELRAGGGIREETRDGDTFYLPG